MQRDLGDLQHRLAKSKGSQIIMRYQGSSLYRAEQDLIIPRSAVHEMLGKRRLTSPYNLCTVQHLEDDGYEACIQFAYWCL